MFKGIILSFFILATLPVLGEAQDLYIVTESTGVVTLTSRRPRKGARFRIVKGRKRSYSNKASRWKPRPIKSDYSHLIQAISLKFGVEPSLVKAMVHVESAYNARATSHKGAMGLMQLMPGTASDMGVKDAYHPTQNIWGGVKYLKMLLSTFDGNEKLSIAAYNAGPNAVKRRGGKIPPYPETQEYVKRVLKARDMYRCVERGKKNCSS